FGLYPGQAERVSIDAVRGFLLQHREWSASRDRALCGHVINRPTYFRAHIPEKLLTQSLLSQFVWYLDEVVINDPLERYWELVERDPQSIASASESIFHDIRFFAQWQPYIDEGFLLLGGGQAMQQEPREASSAARS